MNKQRGFSAIETLLVLMVVSAAGGVGWYVYDLRSKTNVKNPAGSQTEMTNSSTSASPGYLVIQEWSVRLRLSEKSINANYEVVSKDSPNDVVLSSQELDNFVANHKECPAANQLVYLERAKEGEGKEGFTWEAVKASLATKNTKKIGDYYYYDEKINVAVLPPCYGNDTGMTKQLTDQANSLLAKLPSYKDVEALP